MIDDRDRSLLSFLQMDAAIALTTLAERLCLSPSACSRRMQKLRDEGYISGTVAVVDRKRLGIPTTLFVLVRMGRHAPDRVENFRRAIADVPEIVEAHRLTGNFDYLLKLALPNVEYYDHVYKQITQRIDLYEMAGYVSMEVLKPQTGLPTEFAT